MTKEMDVYRLIQSIPKIKAFYIGIMEKTFLFVCWIMMLLSFHTLKNALRNVHYFLSKKIHIHLGINDNYIYNLSFRESFPYRPTG